MRLFVAVDIDDAVRRRLAAVISSCAVRPAFRRLDIAWVPADRLHITIQFIGYVSDAVAGQIRERLLPPYPMPPFSLHLDGLGAFPPGGRVRVIWIGLRRGADELCRLHEETLRRLEGVPFRRETRTFSPHLTIARLRAPGPASLREHLAGAAAGATGRCTIDAVTLYESRLSPRGAAYIPVQRAPLVA
jgi:2'-5' RNA ligase